jgi:hypothetical protein
MGVSEYPLSHDIYDILIGLLKHIQIWLGPLVNGIYQFEWVCGQQESQGREGSPTQVPALNVGQVQFEAVELEFRQGIHGSMWRNRPGQAYCQSILLREAQLTWLKSSWFGAESQDDETFLDCQTWHHGKYGGQYKFAW